MNDLGQITTVVHFGSGGKKTAHMMSSALRKVGTSHGIKQQRGIKVHDLKGSDQAQRERIFHSSDLIISIGSVAIAVRTFGPFLNDKLYDPALISVDQDSKFIVPIIGGHQAHANETASILAKAIRATPVITTASDVASQPSLDTFCHSRGLRIAPRKNYPSAAAALIEKTAVLIDAPEDVFQELKTAFPKVKRFVHEQKIQTRAVSPNSPSSKAATPPKLNITWAKYFVGLGYRKDAPTSLIARAVRSVLKKAKVNPSLLSGVASIDIKRKDSILDEVAAELNVKPHYFSAEELASLYSDVRFKYRLNDSKVPRRRVDVPGVAEPAAILAASHGRIILPRTIINGVVVAVAKERVF